MPYANNQGVHIRYQVGADGTTARAREHLMLRAKDVLQLPI